jgi:hypothetical protein
VRQAVLALALALPACAPAPVPEAGLQAAYAPDAEGIGLPGSPLRIDFGRSEAGVIAAFSRLEKRDPSAIRVCSGGIRAVTWRGGVTLYFRDGAFLGWSRSSDGASAGLVCEADGGLAA